MSALIYKGLIIMAIGNLSKIRSIKSYKNYTEEEIIEMVQTIPTNQLEYDALIDQLYFFDYEKNEEKKSKSIGRTARNILFIRFEASRIGKRK